ncbi:MAG: GAF domain-containing protein, partial [Chloroflexota bacterium]
MTHASADHILSVQNQLEQIYELTSRLKDAENVDDVFELLIDFVNTLPSVFYNFTLADGSGLSYTKSSIQSIPLDYVYQQIEKISEDSIHIPDLEKEVQWAHLSHSFTASNIASIVIIPLKISQKAPSGFLLFAHPQPHFFEHIIFTQIRNVAQQATFVLQNILLQKETKTSLDEAQIMVTASRVLVGAASLPDVYKTMGQVFIETGADKCTLALYVDTYSGTAPTHIQLVEICGPAINDEDKKNIGRVFNLTEDYLNSGQSQDNHDTGYLSPSTVSNVLPYPYLSSSLQTGRITTITDTHSDKNLNTAERALLDHFNIRAQANIPLFSKGGPLGFILVEYLEPYTFTDRELSLLRTIANQTTVAIEHSQEILRTERRMQQIQTGAEISKAANSILRHESLIEKAVNLIRDGFDFYYVGLFLVDDAGHWAILQAGTGSPGQAQLAESHKLVLDENSMIGWSISSKKARINLDVGADAVRFDNPHLPLTRSEMALPLISRSIVLGAISIQSQQPAAFSENDIVTLQIMADQIANALLNSRLFQNALDAQQTTENLYQMSQKVAAAHTIEEAASIAVDYVPKRKFDQVSLYLLDSTNDSNKQAIKRIALWQVPSLAKQVPKEPYTVESIPLIGSTKDNTVLVISDTNNPQFPIDRQTKDTLHKYQVQSAVIVPICVDQAVLGWLIATTSHLNQPYLATDITPLQTVGDQIGIVIDRIQKADSLIKASQQFLTMVANIPGVVYRAKFDRAYVLQYISDDIAELSGYSVGEFLDNNQNLIYNVIHPEDQGRVIAFRRNSTRHQRSYQLKYRIRHKSGETRYIIEYGKAIFEEQGQFIYIDGVLFDVTERETLQRSFQRRAAQFEAIAEVGQATSAILDVDHLIAKTVEQITQTFGFYYAGLFLLDQKREWAVLQAGSGQAGKTMVKESHRLRCDENSMVGWCTYHGQARIALDVGEEPYRFDNPHLPNTHSEIALPLITRGRVIGALDVQSREHNAFTQDDITTLQLMANQLANIIENVRLIEETQRRASQLQISTEISQIVTARLDHHLLLTDSVDLIETRFNFAQTNYYIILNDRSNRVDVYQSGVFDKKAPSYSISRAELEKQPLIDKVIQEQRLIVAQKDAIINLDPNQRLDTDGQPILVIPLQVRNRLVGILEIHHQADHLFTKDQITIMEVLGSQIATAAENARAY